MLRVEMAKNSGKQSGGINVDGSDVVIEGDAVGRDKIETNEYYEKEPYQEWEEFYAGGCLSRTLIVLGTILAVAGFLIFFFSIIIGFTARSFESATAGLPFTVAGFGTIVVGGIILTIGRLMARHGAYRQRSNSRRR
jgi:hypothetical protein